MLLYLIKRIIGLTPSVVCMIGFAQTQGPFTPGSVTTSAGGTVNWTSPSNAASSNNSYAVATNGVSNFIKLSNFGFNIPAGSTINGITMEVERKAAPVSPVAANTWAQYNNAAYTSGTATARYGSTSYAYNLPVSSATNNKRLLVVNIGIENVDNTSPSNPGINMVGVTYNGVAMTLGGVTSMASATTSNYSAVYYLKESGLPTTTGNRNIVITKTFAGEGGSNTISPAEYVEIVGVNTFTNVDQTNSITSLTQTSALLTILASPLNFLRSGDYLVAGTVNNNPATGGNIAPGLFSTEAFERSYSNGGTTTGANFQVQYRSLSGVTGLLSFAMGATAVGSTRLAMTSIAVHAARVYDNSVMLTDPMGALTGNNLALPDIFSNAWDDEDVIEVYGGASNLWGGAWTAADINDPSFGISFQVDATNAISSIDNVRITVNYSVPLGIDLSDLSKSNRSGEVSTGKISLYPNPAISTFYVESDQTISGVEVTDVMGKQLPAAITPLSDMKFQLENIYSNGTYIVLVKTAGGIQANKIVVR